MSVNFSFLKMQLMLLLALHARGQRLLLVQLPSDPPHYLAHAHVYGLHLVTRLNRTDDDVSRYSINCIIRILLPTWGYSSVVERSLCMREASGSNPDISTPIFFFSLFFLHACVFLQKPLVSHCLLSFILLFSSKIDTAYNIQCGVEKQAIHVHGV